MKNILRTTHFQDLLVPCGVIGSLLVILYTLPSPLMDFLLSVNIALGVVILLTTFFVTKPLEFSIFPTVLLGTTLFRLVLNVATTRLILTRGAEYGELAAGHVVKSFSEFVTGESMVAGLVIFGIFIVIQFVVITKGATRISEVAARFTLDAMPGRQMAIDADLNAGAIDEKQARARREELTEQSDFFGAMDGAGKFVRGDAIAALIITVINILGGLFVGVVQHGMPIETALSVYTNLTIGDGLVSQIPAILISLATGILVTRSSQSRNLPRLILEQVFYSPAVLAIAGCFLMFLSMTGMPVLPLWFLAGVCFTASFWLARRKERQELQKREKSRAIESDSDKNRDPIERYLTVDPLELELGTGLISLADSDKSDHLTHRIGLVRREIASQLGFILPMVRIRDSLELDVNQYQIKIGGEQVALGMVYPGMIMAIDSGSTMGPIKGIQTTEPVHGTRAIWITPEEREKAESAGYTVVEPLAIVSSHLAETAKRSAGELLTRDAVWHLIDELKSVSPTVVDELIPNVMKLAEIQQVLQRLLRERVSIRRLETILETLGDVAVRSHDIIQLTEWVRARLARTLCSKYRDEDGTLHAILLAPAMEEAIANGFSVRDNEIVIHLDSNIVNELEAGLTNELNILNQLNFPFVLLTSPTIRPVVRQLTETRFPNLAVLSLREISDDTRVVSEGVIDRFPVEPLRKVS